MQGNRDGFGQAIHHKKQSRETKAFMLDAGAESMFYNNVPIKAVFTQNSLFNDYEHIRNLVMNNLASYPIQLVRYYELCYKNIVSNRMMGVNMDTELQAWYLALASEPQDIQKQVYELFKWNKAKDTMTMIWQKMIRPLTPVVRNYKKGRFSPIFANILDALFWREQQV
jgi:hypothetical protein